MLTVSEKQRQLFDLVAAALFSYPVKAETIEHVDELLEEAENQAVFPLVYGQLPQEIQDTLDPKWKQRLLACYGNNIRVECEHAELHELLSEQGIPYVVIKGCVAASYYPEPIQRILGDVDFLVRPEDLERAGQALEAAGFSPVEEKEHQIHIGYHRGRSTWELHWKVNGIPEGIAGERIETDLQDLIQAGKPYQTQTGMFLGPTPFHHGLILLLHTAKHMLHEGIGLRHLCDWAVFIQGMSDETFCDLFQRKLKAAGLWRFACLLTLLSQKYLHCRTCKWAGRAEETLLEAMAADIMEGGNFGHKDWERINQIYLVNDLQQGTTDDRGMLHGLVTSLTLRAHALMPLTKRIPILLPVGWLYVSVRTLLRAAGGKRPQIHVKKAIQGAHARREIYGKFSLFHTERDE